MPEEMRPSIEIPRGLLRLAYATVIGMFVVVAAGALVTNTGSGEGCGASWPLCDGEWLPAPNMHSIIEYSHRLVTGIAAILVVWMTVWALRAFGWRLEVRVAMWSSIALLVIQSALGAAAVLWPQPDLVMALHFGISLSAFAAVLIPTAVLLEMRRGSTYRSRPLSPTLRRGIWASTIYTYVVVYSGAYVRHTNSHMACLDWPLCNGALIPPLEGAVGIQFAHRVAAGLALFIVGWVLWRAAKEKETRPDIYKGALASFALLVAQVLGGGFVILSRLTITSMMLHSIIVTLLFGAQSLLCLQSFREPKEALPPGRVERAVAT